MKLWGRFLSLLIALTLVGASGSAMAATTSGIFGKVVDNGNKPIANTAITVTQGGVVKYSVKTGADGSYSIPASAGAYSLSYVPPTAANGTLTAYDIIAPLSKSLTVMLTTPMPGRAFVTGNVSLSTGAALATDATIGLGQFSTNSISTTGDYRFLPTAGETGTWKFKVANSGMFAIGLYGQDTQSINQDTIANVVIPIVNQRIRVVTSAGVAVAGARVEGGVGQGGTDWADYKPIEGLGAFKGTWKNSLVTDASGWITTPSVQMLNPSPAGFTVTVPASYKFENQTFTTVAGNGDIILTLNKPSGQLNGSVKDTKGAAIPGVDVFFTGYNKTTDAAGNFSMGIANGSVGEYELNYRSGASAGPMTSWWIRNQIGGAKTTISGVTTKNFVVPLDSTVIKVVDNTGLPVVGANVRIGDDNGYASMGLVTLVAGQTPYSGGFSSIGITDAKGMVTLKTLHLDQPLKRGLIVTPATGSPLSWGAYSANVGQGEAITVTMTRPSVTLSGKVTYSDGTPIAGTHLTFSAGNGGDQGDADIAADGSYSMKVPVGMKGQFYFGCTMAARDLAENFCPNFYGGQVTISADTVKNIVIPTYKTPIHIVDPAGKGLSKVTIQLNTSMSSVPCQGQASIFANKSFVGWTSRVITDANGWAQMPTILMDKPCPVYLFITPDDQSRYQSRNLNLTVGDGASNTIVLTIPAPVIASATTTGDGVKTLKNVTLFGDNFLGVFAVNVDGKVISKFTVTDKTHLTFALPTGVTGGVVTVTNGGGAATFTVK